MVKVIGEVPDEVMISNPTKMPFSHGIECELQIVTGDGKWVPGSEMKNIFREILLNTKIALEGIIAKNLVPLIVRGKLGELTIESDRSKNDAVHVGYEVNGRSKKWSIIGKDSHVSFETNILEVQTPPCEYFEELEWWLHTIFRVSFETVKRRRHGLLLVPTGLNPLEEFSRGVSFGDHHHIQIKDMAVRRTAFNLIRNFTPHLIALSVNSPFKFDEKPHFQTNAQGCLVIPHGHLSNRLSLNNRQLQPVPELLEGETKKDYMEKTKKDAKSMRMVDINPFSPWGTVEVRFIDAQLCTSSRMAMAVLLQAIVLKAGKLVERNVVVPGVSDALLKRNRNNALQSGLLGILSSEPRMDKGPYFQFFSKKDGKPISLHGACINLLFYVKDELHEMGAANTPFLNNFYVQLSKRFKNEDRPAIPITPAQYQIWTYSYTGGNWIEFLRVLDGVSQRSAREKNYDPHIEIVGFASPPGFLIKPLKRGGA